MQVTIERPDLTARTSLGALNDAQFTRAPEISALFGIDRFAGRLLAGTNYVVEYEQSPAMLWHSLVTSSYREVPRGWTADAGLAEPSYALVLDATTAGAIEDYTALRSLGEPYSRSRILNFGQFSVGLDLSGATLHGYVPAGLRAEGSASAEPRGAVGGDESDDAIPKAASEVVAALQSLTGWSRRQASTVFGTSHSTLNRIASEGHAPRLGLRTHMDEVLRVVRRLSRLAQGDRDRLRQALLLDDRDTGTSAAAMLRAGQFADALGAGMRSLRPPSGLGIRPRPLRYYDERSTALYDD